MPFADSAIARYLDKQIDSLKGVKTQREIAAEIGYDKPNLISMFKRGETKIPLDKIPLLAKAVGADPAHLFRLGLEQYWLDLKPTIDEIFERQMASKNETEVFLHKWRAATGNGDPAPSAEIATAVDKMLADLFKKITKRS